MSEIIYPCHNLSWNMLVKGLLCSVPGFWLVTSLPSIMRTVTLYTIPLHISCPYIYSRHGEGNLAKSFKHKWRTFANVAKIRIRTIKTRLCIASLLFRIVSFSFQITRLASNCPTSIVQCTSFCAVMPDNVYRYYSCVITTITGVLCGNTVIMLLDRAPYMLFQSPVNPAISIFAVECGGLTVWKCKNRMRSYI